MLVLQDKFVDMRKSAEACLVELIRVFDIEPVLQLFFYSLDFFVNHHSRVSSISDLAGSITNSSRYWTLAPRLRDSRKVPRFQSS